MTDRRGGFAKGPAPEWTDVDPAEWAPEEELGQEPAKDDGDPGVPMDDALLERRSIFRPRVRKPNFVLSVAVNVVRVMAVILLLAGVAGAGVLAGVAKGYMETAPTLDRAAIDDQDQTSYIYDASGNLITEYKGTENREMVSLTVVPMNLRNAFVAVEDARFYQHNGVDYKRIGGAFLSNLSGGSTQGGSTITQQLIKNTLLSSEQSYKRKIQEAYLAIEMEQELTQEAYDSLLAQRDSASPLTEAEEDALQAAAKREAKDTILENYMNTIWLGENYYGIQVAARGYFGKELAELSLRECAMLAGLANSPYYYNPRRNLYTRRKEGTDYVAITNDRTDYVLRRMYECGFITYEDYRAALNPETASVLEEDTTATGMYPYAHYVEYAVSEVVDIFLELRGLEDTAANRSAMESEFRTGGYRVELAIDTSIQESVQTTLSNWSGYPSLRDPSDRVYRASNGDGTYTEIIQPQAAAAVIDYRTGEIKAIVGSRDEPTVRKSLNRATDMRMPVGSSIKPLTVYAPALERGASPATVVFNMPLPISGWLNANRQDSWPTNYGGGGYTGPITLREAMRRSYNTAAAQTMMTIVGVENAVSYLRQMGVDDSHIDATPFGVTLGSSGITPLQMSVAYGVLANGGVYIEPISVLGISRVVPGSDEPEIIWDGHQHQEQRRVFSASTAYMVVDMLKTVVSSGTGTSAKIRGQTVAGKTGTNSDQRGVTFAGITGYYSSCVWVGHDNYKPLSSRTTGSGAAAPLWQAYMAKIHEGLANRDILEGDASQYGLVRVTTCTVSGQLATDACRADSDHGVVTEYWRSGTQPTINCQMHVTEQVCAESGMLASPYCPNVTSSPVVTIPVGHPLYQFLGTRYESDIRKYLTLSSNTGGQICTLHTAYSQPQDTTSPSTPGESQDTRYEADARSLVSQARAMLSGLDAGSAQAMAISAAIDRVESILSGPYDTATLISAMSQLTQAMAGTGY